MPERTSSTWSWCSTEAKAARRTSAPRAFRTPRFSGFPTSNLTELLIRGGSVYGPDGPVEADVHISDCVITGVEAGAATSGGATVIDARGMYAIPGALDAHVHNRDPGFPGHGHFRTSA